MAEQLRIVLASASPRRLAILRQADIEPKIAAQDLDETPLPGENPLGLVERLACAKAKAAAGSADGATVIAADTVVWLEGEILGKPADAKDASRMLRLLSGKTHHVSTGVCAITRAGTPQARQASFVETTDVHFFELTEDLIASYVATGEPLDKAGAYGYQAGGCVLVESISGDYYNVVGLPIGRLLRMLEELEQASDPLNGRFS